MKTLPKTLYKYRPCDKFNADIILCNQLRFTRPSSFNDPFDCKFQIVFEGSDSELKSFLMEGIVTNNPEWDKDHVESYAIEILQLNIIENVKKDFSEKYVINELERMDILCLSQKKDDILMWSHYAKQHTGICLGFDSNKWPMLKFAKPVNYISEYPVVNAISPQRENAVKDIVFRKSIRWKYEEEWRVIRGATSNQRYIFPPEALIEIIFGYRVKDFDMKMTIIMAYRSSCEPKFFITRPSNNKYNLKVEALNINNSMIEEWLEGKSPFNEIA